MAGDLTLPLKVQVGGMLIRRFVMELLIVLFVVVRILDESPLLGAGAFGIFMVWITLSDPLFRYTITVLFGLALIFCALLLLHRWFRRKFPRKKPPPNPRPIRWTLYIMTWVLIGMIWQIFWLDQGLIWEFMVWSFMTTALMYVVLALIALWAAL